ncbi:hypothetical protein VNO80_30439 [Phaseolus coccineus]|uniref:PPC domain-containing protein n=1 Tax=Phaseolus coccineus TaxID=3886 RepID=A0AAN9QFT2_PHACN
MRNNSLKINDSSSSRRLLTNSSSQSLQPPQTATTNQPPTTQSASRRPRGRPVGSKNKPKPSLPVPQTTDSTMNLFIFNVAPNRDIMESILEIAHRDHVSVTVMNASGMINKVTLESSTESSTGPSPCSPSLDPTYTTTTASFTPVPPLLFPHPLGSTSPLPKAKSSVASLVVEWLLPPPHRLARTATAVASSEPPPESRRSRRWNPTGTVVEIAATAN